MPQARLDAKNLFRGQEFCHGGVLTGNLVPGVTGRLRMLQISGKRWKGIAEVDFPGG